MTFQSTMRLPRSVSNSGLNILYLMCVDTITRGRSRIAPHRKVCFIMENYYRAAMVLSGVGDAMGYRDGSWEFNYSGKDIQSQLESKYGGVRNIHLKVPDWPVSDDTVLHLATAGALMTGKPVGEELFKEIAFHYVKGSRDLVGREPGYTTVTAIKKLEDTKGYIIPFNPRGGGCGGAMRAMCIGLRYPSEDQLSDLIAVAVEAGRMTHNCPTGYLGSVASALFTSFAIQRKPVESWGASLMATLPAVMEYIRKVGRDVEQNEKEWDYFTDKWTKYLKERGLTDGQSKPVFPEKYGVEERDEFYKSLSFGGWGGASGHDAPMIAYDALLAARDSWEKFCDHCVFHGGDNDSTGVIGCAWWGALHGLDGVPECNYKDVEYRERLEAAAKKLYQLSQDGTS